MNKEPLIGRRHPPISTRFVKGQSGNPRGRPRGSKRQPPYEAVLGQMVTVREDGVSRRMSAAEAFLLHITRQGLEGNGSAARAAMAAIEAARQRHDPVATNSISHPTYIVFTSPSVNNVMSQLRMATKLDPYRPTARMALEPWLIEAALGRFKDEQLNLEQQKCIWKAARTPWKVKWPSWWEYRG